MTSNRATTTNSPTGVAWVLLATAFALPWLISFQAQPWTKFYSDWAMAVILIPVMAWALAARPGGWPLSRLALGAAALAVVPLLQALAGRLLYAQDGWLVAAMLATVGLAVLLGRRCEAIAPGRLIDAMFAGLALAALLSTGLAVYQWVGLDAMGMLVLPLPPGGRVVANVGQPNQLATLLLWGMLAFWWAYLHNRIGAVTAVLAVGFVLIGLVATQSRTGLLGALLIGAAAVLVGRRGSTRRVRAVVLLALGTFTALLMLTWPAINHAVLIDAGLTLQQQTDVGRRPLIWRLMLDAVAKAPWFGYGWNQGVVAQQAVMTEHAPLHLVVQHSHNLFIDLMVWNGAAVGLLASVGLMVWFVVRWGTLRAPEHVVLLLCPTTLLFHSLLELPHVHMMFLLPAAIAMGTLDSPAQARQVALLPRWAIGALTLSLSAFAAMLMLEYRSVESDLMATRIRLARIGNLTPVAPPSLTVLTQLGGVLQTMRVTPHGGMDAATLSAMQRSAQRYPGDGALYRSAMAAALNDQPAAATRSLEMLCSMYSADTCERASAAWRAASTINPILLYVQPPQVAAAAVVAQ